MYSHIIWDFNGTILNDTALCVQTENLLRTQRNQPEITIPFYQEHLCFPIKNYYLNIGMDFGKESYEELAERYMDIYQPASLNAPLREGVMEYIAAQNKKGRKQILLSAAKREHLLEQTDHFGLTGFFDEILGLDDILGNSKIEIAVNYFSGKGIKPYDMVVIGDTLHDFDVAKALKCACILLTGGHNSRERLIATGAPVLEDISELYTVLG
jgi:phosphoglycolate phosphatase